MSKIRWLALAAFLCCGSGGAFYLLWGHWTVWLELGGHRYTIGHAPSPRLSPGDPEWNTATKKKNPSIAQLAFRADGRTEFESRSGTCGYVDDNGDIVIPATFDMTYPFKGDRAIVAQGGGMALIDRSGRFVFGPDKRIDTVTRKKPDHFVIKYFDGHAVEIDHGGKVLGSDIPATQD